MCTNKEDQLLLLENSLLQIWYLSNFGKGNWSCSVHEINKNRCQFGEFHNLCEDLQKYPESFYYILDKIHHNVINKWA